MSIRCPGCGTPEVFLKEHCWVCPLEERIAFLEYALNKIAKEEVDNPYAFAASILKTKEKND